MVIDNENYWIQEPNTIRNNEPSLFKPLNIISTCITGNINCKSTPTYYHDDGVCEKA